MTDFTDSEARIHRFVAARGNEREQRAQRAAIRPAMLKLNPEMTEAVCEDIDRLAKAAVQERGFADLSDLTRAGYTEEMALWSAERLAQAHRAKSLRTAPRFTTNEGEAA